MLSNKILGRNNSGVSGNQLFESYAPAASIITEPLMIPIIQTISKGEITTPHSQSSFNRQERSPQETLQNIEKMVQR